MSRVDEYKKNISDLYVWWKDKKSNDGKINHAEQIFIEDGVICPEQWFSQDVRPLFLLKEAYGWGKDGSLIDEYLMDENIKLYRIWRNVCEWTEGIFETTKECLPVYHETKHKYYGNDSLKKAAVINIKKSGGKKSSNMDEINQYAKFDKEELMREIEICDPTIIICGYTISSLNILTDNTVKDEKHPDRDWVYSLELNGHKVIVIDYYHPANQYPKMMNYYTLMRIYQLALQRE